MITKKNACSIITVSPDSKVYIGVQSHVFLTFNNMFGSNVILRLSPPVCLLTMQTLYLHLIMKFYVSLWTQIQFKLLQGLEKSAQTCFRIQRVCKRLHSRGVSSELAHTNKQNKKLAFNLLLTGPQVGQGPPAVPPQFLLWSVRWK